MSERITITVQVGDALFSAEGPSDVVLFMYQDWLNTINGCTCEIPETSDAPELPAFRNHPIGRA